jgi:PAT family beta-lactamase induction signal transducer AmpG
MATDGPPRKESQEPASADRVARGARSFLALYLNRPMAVLLALGFAGGLPFVMITDIATAWATAEGWDLQALGVLGFWTIPYALKFLWAPMVDALPVPGLGRLGLRRGWLLLTQCGALAGLLLLGLVGPADRGAFLALVAAVAFLSATQDAVADAFRAESLRPEEMGAGASTFVTGYRIAFVALGAGILMSAGSIGWRTAALVGAASMAVGVVATLCAREPDLARPRPGVREAVVAPVAAFWEAWGPRFWALVLFVLLFKLPDQLANAITTPLLMKGLGYSVESIGWVRQAFGIGMTIVGAIAGGWMVARLGLVRCLWIFGIAHCVSIGGFLALALSWGATVAATPAAPPPVLALVPAIGIENFVIGLVTSGFVAFLMGVCDRRFTATQYALLTALMAAGNSLAKWGGGVLAAELDYPLFLAAAMLAGIPGVLLIPWVTGGQVRSPVPWQTR